MDLLINLTGGLGLFLFGMNYMSQGMQKVAGTKLRGLLAAMTEKKLVAVLFGALFTAVIQSSGATTVMVVSFVNAGMMSVAQSVGLIFGANIGTTITAQLVALKLTAIAPYILLLGAIMMVFIKKPFVKQIGEVVLGFGCLFMGISMMTDAMNLLGDFPSVLNVLSSLSNPILSILLGFLITAVLQSSSVTVSIVLLMASQGLIELPICLFFILGCNIGSCTPAVIASLDGNKDAKRAALIHVMFNVFGMVILGLILAVAMNPVLSFLHMISGDGIGRCVANADTMFKIFQTIIFFPISSLFVKLTYILVPGEDQDKGDFSLQYIGIKNKIAPSTGTMAAIHEINRMGTLAIENFDRALNAFYERDDDALKKVYEQEKHIDYLSDEITNYLVELITYELPPEDSARVGGLFHVVNDIERIGDHAENIADAAARRYNEDIEFSKKSMKELRSMQEKVDAILSHAMTMFYHNDKTYLDMVTSEEKEIDLLERELQKNHVKRMAKGKCNPTAGMLFTDIVTGLERIGDHSTNIAYSILESAPIEDDDEEIE